MTSYELGDFTPTSRPYPVLTQRLIHWVSAALFPRSKSVRTSVVFKNVWNFTLSPAICLHGLVLAQFYLYLLILQFSFFNVCHEMGRFWGSMTLLLCLLLLRGAGEAPLITP